MANQEVEVGVRSTGEASDALALFRRQYEILDLDRVLPAIAEVVDEGERLAPDSMSSTCGSPLNADTSKTPASYRVLCSAGKDQWLSLAHRDLLAPTTPDARFSSVYSLSAFPRTCG